MANSREIMRYKQQILSLIINNEDIVRLIDNKKVQSVEDSEELINENVFNFIRVPEAPEEEKTYICVEVDIPTTQTTRNNLLKDLIIIIYIITHERLMPTSEGARTDCISSYIDEMLTGYKNMGIGELELKSNTANGVGVRHRCRIMEFRTMDLRESGCK